MKNLFKIAAMAGLAFTLASCGAANDIYGNNGYPNSYPSSGNQVYRAPDGRIYKAGDVYRDRNGNVYQNGRVVRTGDVYGQPGIFGGNDTYSGNRRNLPPGQAKKIYGGSAKDYAYGQTKKRNNTYNNRTWRDDDYRRDDDRRYRNDDHKGKKGKKGKGHKH